MESHTSPGRTLRKALGDSCPRRRGRTVTTLAAGAAAHTGACGVRARAARDGKKVPNEELPHRSAGFFRVEGGEPLFLEGVLRSVLPQGGDDGR